MPPKGSGRRKKNTAGVETLKNGDGGDLNGPEQLVEPGRNEQTMKSTAKQLLEEKKTHEAEEQNIENVEVQNEIEKETGVNGVVGFEGDIPSEQKKEKNQDKKAVKSGKKNKDVLETENFQKENLNGEVKLNEETKTEDVVPAKQGRSTRGQTKVVSSKEKMKNVSFKAESADLKLESSSNDTNNAPKSVRDKGNSRQQAKEILEEVDDVENDKAEDDKEIDPLTKENEFKKNEGKTDCVNLPKTKESSSKKGGRKGNARQQAKEIDEVEKDEVEDNEETELLSSEKEIKKNDDETDCVTLPKTKENPSKKKGGRKGNVRQQAKEILEEMDGVKNEKAESHKETELLSRENEIKNQDDETDSVTLPKTKENSSKKRGGRRGNAKQQVKEILEERNEVENDKAGDDKETEPLSSENEFKTNDDKTDCVNLPKTKGISPKKKGGRNVRQQSDDSSIGENNSKIDEHSSVDQKKSEIEYNIPKKKGGRNVKRQLASITTEDKSNNILVSTTEKTDDKESNSQRSEAKRRGRPKANQQLDNPIAEAPALKEIESAKETVELSRVTKEKAPKKRGGRLFKSMDVIPEAKVLTQQGRKRKNAKETVQMDEEEHSDIKRDCRVFILREQSVEDLVLANIVEADAKVKTAKGSSKTSGRGKRAATAESGSSKPAKVPKDSSSKPSKKEKIPDPTALDFSNNSTSADGKPWNLKISSWNVNGIRAWLEKNGVSYLNHEKPDIVCLQETKCSDDKLPKEANVDGYHCYWVAGDKDGYSGVGLLSKEEPLSLEYGIGVEEHDKEGRVITAEYEKFYLVATYVPNAGRGLVRLQYRMQWDIDFRSYLKKLDEKKPVILCGDLNVAHQEIDLANPKTNKKNAGFTKEERDGFSSLLSEGFVDTFRHLYPDEKNAYTFWTYMMNARAKNVGWRLDYFVISKTLSNHLCDSVIRKDVMGSDHCPVCLFLCV